MPTSTEAEVIQRLASFKESRHYYSYQSMLVYRPLLQTPVRPNNPQIRDFLDILSHITFGTAFFNSFMEDAISVPDFKLTLEDVIETVDSDIHLIENVMVNLDNNSTPTFGYELANILYFQLNLLKKSINKFFNFTGDVELSDKTFYNKSDYNTEKMEKLDYDTYDKVSANNFEFLKSFVSYDGYAKAEVLYADLEGYLENLSTQIHKMQIDTPFPILDLIEVANKLLISSELFYHQDYLRPALEADLGLTEESAPIREVERIHFNATLDKFLQLTKNYNFDKYELRQIPVLTIAIVDFVLEDDNADVLPESDEWVTTLSLENA